MIRLILLWAFLAACGDGRTICFVSADAGADEIPFNTELACEPYTIVILP